MPIFVCIVADYSSWCCTFLWGEPQWILKFGQSLSFYNFLIKITLPYFNFFLILGGLLVNFLFLINFQKFFTIIILTLGGLFYMITFDLRAPFNYLWLSKNEQGLLKVNILDFGKFKAVFRIRIPTFCGCIWLFDLKLPWICF